MFKLITTAETNSDIGVLSIQTANSLHLTTNKLVSWMMKKSY